MDQFTTENDEELLRQLSQPTERWGRMLKIIRALKRSFFSTWKKAECAQLRIVDLRVSDALKELLRNRTIMKRGNIKYSSHPRLVKEADGRPQATNVKAGNGS